MDLQQWVSERDFVAQYVLTKMKEAAGLLGVSDIMDFHMEAKVNGGTADLIALKSGKRMFVLEAKFKKKSGKVERDIEPRDPEVIKQAIEYAVYGGFPYYLTCNTKRIILFQLLPGKKPFESEISSYEFEKDNTWAEDILKVVLGQTPVKLKELDDTLVDTLHEAFNDLYPEFLSALKGRLKDDRFSKKYEEWLESQGLRPGDETNRLIAEQSTYLQINKLLFYQVIRTIYPDRLDPLSIGEDEDLQEALMKFYEQARKIDYASVYESDVISEIPLTLRAKERFRTLIDTLNQFDFSSMKSDFLGRVYEKLIPPEERKRLGQFYTPPAIAELITLLTIQNKDDLILDPGCGSGTFLVKAYQWLKELKGFKDVSGPLFEEHHREILSQLYGVDINQFPAHLSVINLSIQNPAAKVNKINVVVNDFFDIEAGQETLTGFESITPSGEKTAIKMPPRFDVVVANPPYIRQELLGSKEKDKIKRRIEKDFYRKVYIGQKPPGEKRDAIILDKQSDVYIYFFLHGLSMLREGGRLGFITSNKWLEVGYGEPFQEFLLKNTKIKYVIEFDRAVFPDAEVNTAISILEKETNEQARNENNVKFVRLKQKMSNDEVMKILKKAEESYEDEKVRVNVVKQGSLAPGKWSIYLRAPPVYQKIVNHPKMKPLGEIAKVFRGLTTGYNDYFILDEEKVREWGIEKEFLVPCVSSPKKVKGLIIRPEDVKEYCFMVGEDQEVPEDSNAYKYIKYGEELEVEVTRGSQRGKRKLPELETVKGRKRWYSLPKLEVANILLPNMIRERFAVWLNGAKAHTPDVFYYLVIEDPQNAPPLAAYLNSSVAKLLCELEGRQYTGMLEMKAYEWKSFPTINLDYISSDERNRLSRLFFNLAESTELRLKIEKQYEALKSKSAKDKGILEYELEEKLEEARKNEKNAQKELDEAIYDILGLSQEERRQVEDGLKELQEIRRKRTQS